MIGFLPQLFWFEHQKEISFSLTTVEALSLAAIKLAQYYPRYAESSLPAKIEISFLDPSANSTTHQNFFGDPTPTDVMTFRHDQQLGEILLGVAVIEEHAKKYYNSLEEELVRCVLHGALHLLDYDDQTAEEHQTMHQLQEKILRKVITGEKNNKM
jgi:probable rRNA maturation factor